MSQQTRRHQNMTTMTIRLHQTVAEMAENIEPYTTIDYSIYIQCHVELWNYGSIVWLELIIIMNHFTDIYLFYFQMCTFHFFPSIIHAFLHLQCPYSCVYDWCTIVKIHYLWYITIYRFYSTNANKTTEPRKNEICCNYLAGAVHLVFISMHFQCSSIKMNNIHGLHCLCICYLHAVLNIRSRI